MEQEKLERAKMGQALAGSEGGKGLGGV